MRGTVAINIKVPTKGLVRNVPIHEAPEGSLVDGSNVYVDEDGILKVRQGYSPVGNPLVPAERITGIIGYQDQSGVFQEVVGTVKRWQKYNNDTTFTDISGGLLLNGDAGDPVHFVSFPQGGTIWVYGINNIDPLLAWNSSLSSYFQVVGGVPSTITSITESGTTATVTLISQVLGIKIGDTVTITGNSVSAYNASWVVTGVGLNTFTFVSGGGHGTGTGGTAVDPAGGASFTSARDIEVLANRVVVVNTLESGTRFTYRVRWSAINDGMTWPAGAVLDLADGQDQDEIVGLLRTSRTSAIIYREKSAWLLSAYPGDDSSAFSAERIPVVDNMTGPCSPSAMVVAEGYHFYLGQDGRVYQYDGNTIYPISDPIDPVVRPMLNTQTSNETSATYIPNKRGVVFFLPTVGDGPQADPMAGVMYNLRRQAFEPVMDFADAITAAAVVEETNSLTWLNWVGPSVQWQTMPFPWASWASIPQSEQLSCWIATLDGTVQRFFVAPSDNGQVIAYSAVFPPTRQDPRKTQKISDVELYLLQQPTEEQLSFIIWGLLQPYDTPGTAIMAVAVNLADQSTFSVPVQPGPLNPQNIQANFLQYRLQGGGPLSQLFFAGGTIFVDLDDRRTGYGIS